MKWRIEVEIPDGQPDDSWSVMARSAAVRRISRFQGAIERGFPWTCGIEVTSAECIDDEPKRVAFDRRTAFDKHEECRQAFISSTMAVRDGCHDPRYALMRANAAVAQGLVWAELCGVDPAGWIDRMNEIQTLWDGVK